MPEWEATLCKTMWVLDDRSLAAKAALNLNTSSKDSPSCQRHEGFSSPSVTFVISVQRDACACSGGLTVAQCVATVDPDMTDADGGPNGVFKGGDIAHGGGIECHEVGGAAHYDAPPAFHPEGIG